MCVCVCVYEVLIIKPTTHTHTHTPQNASLLQVNKTLFSSLHLDKVFKTILVEAVHVLGVCVCERERESERELIINKYIY